MDTIIVLGVVGSVASIIGIFLPAKGWRHRVVHVVYGLAIAGLGVGIMDKSKELDRINDVERAAQKMIADFDMNYTYNGFIQASLAFLEKNRDLYPDSYARAKALCESHDCWSNNGAEPVEIAYTMKGLLSGIATIQSGNE
ncbi:MAG: hypothetical protein JNL52_03075 [Flavobacteriales bacterium]|nr:hypothetical protein [Flavobacteriales bacterium]